MKKLLLISTILLTSTICFGQSKPLLFSDVIKSDSTDKATLFATINDWFATNYKSLSDVIQMVDKDAGILIAKGAFKYYKKGFRYECYNGFVDYTIKVYVKDNRYKVIITDFRHSVKSGGQKFCSLGLITTAQSYVRNKHNNKQDTVVWNEIKVKAEEYSNQIFKSFNEKTNEQNKPLINDDW